MTSMLITFVVVSVVLTAIPGPDSLLVVRSGLRGRGQATAVGAGSAVAALAWGVAAAFGLAVILERSALAFTVVKLAGAAYLTFLGVRTLWSTRRAAAVPETAEATESESRNVWSGLRTGTIAGLLNPKTGLFYVAILPQILPKDAAVLPSTLLFAAIDALVCLAYFSLLAALAALLLPYLRRPKVLRTAERITGVTLLGVGFRAALEKG
ncbi:MAG: LysE family translocator [Catenulispora sp.]|nr:LysE family translocator [Catenulispora sp.]